MEGGGVLLTSIKNAFIYSFTFETRHASKPCLGLGFELGLEVVEVVVVVVVVVG